MKSEPDFPKSPSRLSADRMRGAFAPMTGRNVATQRVFQPWAKFRHRINAEGTLAASKVKNTLATACSLLLTSAATTLERAIMKTTLRKAAAPEHRSRFNGNVRAHPKRPSSGRHPRRRFLRLAAGAAALPAVSRIASAKAYPPRPYGQNIDQGPRFKELKRVDCCLRRFTDRPRKRCR
jgi:hypothetical protein